MLRRADLLIETGVCDLVKPVKLGLRGDSPLDEVLWTLSAHRKALPVKTKLLNPPSVRRCATY